MHQQAHLKSEPHFRITGSNELLTFKIFDLHSREVATVEDRVMPEGEQVVSFDTELLPAGIYVWRQLSPAVGGINSTSDRSAVGKLIKL